MNNEINPIDDAIRNCESLITQHQKQSRKLFTLIMCTVVCFLFVLGYPTLTYIFAKTPSGYVYYQEGQHNPFIDRLKTAETFDKQEYERVVSNAISYQKLINAYDNSRSKYTSEVLGYRTNNPDDYIVYGIFLVILAISTSFYRFHLKEISKYELFLIGFQRVKIAGTNSSTRYDAEIKFALTDNAFYFDNSKKRNVESPIPGHPTSDLLVNLLNKILDKVEFKGKSSVK